MRTFIATLCLMACACGGDDPPQNPTGDDGDTELPPAPVARLAVSGTELVDANGDVVRLRGWNWGHWGSVQSQDAADNVAQGANVVRIPLRWWGAYKNDTLATDPKDRIDARDDAAPGHIEATHLATLDATIKQATDNGLWVIFFMDSNCGQGSFENGDPEYCGAIDGAPATFANNPDATEKFMQAWEFLADRYRDHPRIAMYELLPEPQFGCNEKKCFDWKGAQPFYRTLIARIRAIDDRVPLMVGATGGYDVDHLEDAFLADTRNIVYTGNFLNGAAGKPEKIAFVNDFRAAHDVPVFIQQVGSRKSEEDAASRAATILDTLNTANVGWTWWTYREANSSSGTGYAPYYAAEGGGWNEDLDWLALIASKM